jgi:glycosyltransferase involved in cell wall biosynthesis
MQPLGALEQSARAQVLLLGDATGLVRMPNPTELARLAPQVLLLHNTVHDTQIEALRGYRRHANATIVFGQDDLMTDLPPKNPFSRTVFRDYKKRLRQCLALSDRLVVTTEPLAAAYRGWIDDIRVVPNYLARAIWQDLHPSRRASRKVRVGWAGAMQHAGDLEWLGEVVRELSGEVEWVFLGMCPEPMRPYLAELHGAVAFGEYPAKLASLALDIALAPLEHNRFNECKSNLRILEYGALGWPVLASDIEPYRGAPVTRLPNNPRAWINAIRERVHDLDAAEQEGERLRAWVHAHWMLEDHLHEWLEALSPTSAAQGEAVAPTRQTACR